MAQTFSKYNVTFLEGAAKTGLGYTLKRGLSAPFAAVGHFLDTLLGLDGLFLDKDHHLSGPFGFLMGIVPFIVGFILGSVLHVLLRAFCWIPHYVLDWPLSFLFKGFNKKMAHGEYAGKVSAFFVFLTEETPSQMHGPFGFIFGLVPHIILHIVNRIFGLTTSTIEFTTDHTCDGIRYVYGGIGHALCGAQPNQNNDPDLTQSASAGKTADATTADAKPDAPPKKLRVKRAAENQPPNEETEPKLFAMVKQEVDLLDFLRAEIGLLQLKFSVDNYTQRAYQANAEEFAKNIIAACKKVTAPYHQDKHGQSSSDVQAQAKEKYEKVEAMRIIFSDLDQTKKYMAFHMKKFTDPVGLGMSSGQTEESNHIGDHRRVLSPAPSFTQVDPAPAPPSSNGRRIIRGGKH